MQVLLFLAPPGQSPLRKVTEDVFKPPTLFLEERQDQASQRRH